MREAGTKEVRGPREVARREVTREGKGGCMEGEGGRIDGEGGHMEGEGGCEEGGRKEGDRGHEEGDGGREGGRRMVPVPSLPRALPLTTSPFVTSLCPPSLLPHDLFPAPSLYQPQTSRPPSPSLSLPAPSPSPSLLPRALPPCALPLRVQGVRGRA